MKIYGGVEVQMCIFLTSAVDGGVWSASSSCRVTTGEIAPRYPLNRRLVGPQSQSVRYGGGVNIIIIAVIKIAVVWHVRPCRLVGGH
jgi:hypothetical protein